MKELARRIYRNLPIVREVRQIRARLAENNAALRDLHERLVCREAVRLDLELAQHPRYGDPKRLQRYGSQANSQNMEDGVIWEIFRRIGTTHRVFAEIGVGDGGECNTSLLLSAGWTGFWIDGNPSFLEMIKRRPDLRSGVTGLADFVSRENVAGLFERLNVPRDLDFLSIDVDQNTYYIWEGLAQWKPRAVAVEYNAALPPDLDWKVRYDPNRVWDGTQNFGASLKAFEVLGRQLDYRLVGCDLTGTNAFFVRSDLVGDKFSEPFTAENHHEPPRYAYGAHRRSHANAVLDRPAEGKGRDPIG